MKISLPLKILFRGILGLLIFLILLGAANLLKIYITHPFYIFFVDTFNQAFWIIIVLSILFIAADIFRALTFPFNLPYPILNAFAFVYLASLLFEILPPIIIISGIEIPWKLSTIKLIIILAVFALTVVSGYIHVFAHRHDYEKNKQQKTQNKKSSRKRN